MGRASKGGVTSRDVLSFNDNSAAQEQFFDYPDLPNTGVQAEQERFYVFKLVDTKKKGGSYIDGIDDVVNPKTGKVERVRLLSGVDSIWQKDQKDLTDDYVRQNRRSLVFPRGQKILQISEKDHTLLEFARVCNKNVKHPRNRKGMPHEFFEYNPQAEAEEALARETAELETAILASQQTDLVVRKHAAFLGINLFDAYGLPKEIKKIRQEYIVAAKRNPKRFNESINSKDVEVTFMVRKAVMENKIDISSPDRNLRWASGITITKLPERESAIEYLVELALTNSDEGREFLSQLETISN